MNNLKDINIMAVDDEPLAILLLEEFLNRRSYNVRTAESGKEALKKLKEKPADILITDIMMPHMSGIDLTKRVLENNPDTVVIGITAIDSIENAVEFMKTGGMDFIQKPVSLDDLEAAIENAIKRFELKKALDRVNQELINKNIQLQDEIEKRLSVQKSLEASRDDLKSIFDAMNDFVFILDTHGCVLSVNPVVCNQLGFSENELFGMNILELHSPQNLENVSHVVSDMLIGKPTLMTGHLTKKYGMNLEVETKISKAKWSGKDALIAVSRDVTDYKKAQRNMEAIINAFKLGEVDAVVQKKDIFLVRPETQVRKTEENLKQSVEKQNFLHDLNAKKDKFFSIIGHDLRGMFNSLIVSTDMLIKISKKENSPKITKFATILKKSTHNAYELLENLLTWSRSQRGKIDVTFLELNLKNIIKHNIDLFLERAEQKSILLTYDVPENLKVFVDKNIVDTILRNLIANALKFTYPGGKIHVFIEQKDNCVHISVQDNGTGIEPEDLEKLFRIDSKFKRKGTDKEPSTGLGLILCKELAQKNDGDIWASSEEGRGSIFSFSVRGAELIQKQH